MKSNEYCSQPSRKGRLCIFKQYFKKSSKFFGMLLKKFHVFKFLPMETYTTALFIKQANSSPRLKRQTGYWGNSLFLK